MQRFGGIAWFSLAYGCNDNKEDNSCDDKDKSNRYLSGGLNAFIKVILATVKGGLRLC